MNKFLLLLFLIISPTLFSQIIFNFSKNKYFTAKVYLEDGTIKEGYLKDFNDENFVSFYPQKIAELFGSVEEINGLANDFYYFIKDENSEVEKIDFKNIKTIDFAKEIDNSEDYKFTLEKVKIVNINNDLQIEVSETDVLLPIYYSSGKIKIYSMLINFGSANIPYFYLKKPESEYAVNVFKVTIGDAINMKKIGPKMYESLSYFGKDCEEFSQKLLLKKDFYYNDFVQFSRKHFDYKIFQQKSNDMEKEIKKAKKTMTKDELENYKSALIKKYLDDKTKYFYDNLIDESVIDYINSCE